MVKIHAIRTGLLGITENHYIGKGGDATLLRLFNWLRDSKFHPFIPVHTWLIEHPEGLILVDTGETARAHDPSFFPAFERRFWTSHFRFQLSREDEIDQQLQKLGYTVGDIRRVVMTHAHMDHSDGLPHFLKTEVIFSRAEYEAVKKNGTRHGCLPEHWLSLITPMLIDYVPEPIATFTHSYPLTSDGRIRAVPTPGHTVGHQSIIVEEDGLYYFIAGDTSFDIPRLLDDKIDGVTVNARQIRQTRQKIREMARQCPTVYLPSHDHDAGKRLVERITLKI